MRAKRPSIAVAWYRLSRLGSDPYDRVEARVVAATNQLAVIGSVVGVIQGLGYLLLAPAELHPIGLMYLGLIAAWACALWLNLGGNRTSAALVALVAPVAAFAALALAYGHSGGFQLLLLTAGGLAFLMFRTSQWWIPGVLVLISAFVFLYVELAAVRGDISAGTQNALDKVFVSNAVLVVLILYVIAWFNHTYFIKERRRSERLLAEAQHAAQHDLLTGAYNRRGIAPLMSDVARAGPYSLALGDLDRFKRINDRLGHSVGDVVLANVARTLALTVGNAGVIARWGGEEFLVLMPGMPLANASELLDSAREAIEIACRAEGWPELITMSVGVVHAPRYAGKEEVLRMADALLYEAKASGRNVVISGEIGTPLD